jgi:hypothetical protein
MKTCDCCEKRGRFITYANGETLCDACKQTTSGFNRKGYYELRIELERAQARINALTEETGQWQSYFLHAVAGLSRSAEAGEKYRLEAIEHFSELVDVKKERDQLRVGIERCPNCRDYDLERQWCGNCKQPEVVNVNSDADLISRFKTTLFSEERIRACITQQDFDVIANQILKQGEVVHS